MILKRLFLSIFLLLSTSVFAAENLTDPYQILQKHFDSMGGFDKVKAERTSYLDAKLSFAGLNGTFKEWRSNPDKFRQDVDLKIFIQSSGDDGEANWVRDSNGKVKINRDEATLKDRKLNRLMNEYEYMNKDSHNFIVTFEGIEKVGETDCYVVKIANAINDDVVFEYFATTNFYQLKTVEKKDTEETHTIFSDFRANDGLVKPFNFDIVEQSTGQEQKIEIVEYQSNPEIDPVTFAVPEDNVKDYEFANGINAENVPFYFVDNHLLITVSIDNNEQLWFLDSGAEVTVIDKGYADKMGIASQGDLKGKGVNEVVSLSFVELPPYEVEGVTFTNQKAAALDIAPLFYQSGYETVGILGYDFLSRFVTKIDYANETISFYEPEKFEYKGEGKIMDAPMVNKIFTLPMTVDGRHSGSWSVDIGAGGLSFFYPYAKENGLLDRPGVKTMSGGAGGYFFNKTARFESVDLAGFIVNDPVIDIPIEQGKGGFASSKSVGNLGNSILKRFVVYFDYDNQKMILEKGSLFDSPYDYNRSGLQLEYSPEKDVLVAFVIPGSTADKKGFLKGDRLVSINGIGVDKLKNMFALEELFEQKAGTEYSIEFERGGKIRTVKLKLKDLF